MRIARFAMSAHLIVLSAAAVNAQTPPPDVAPSAAIEGAITLYGCEDPGITVHAYPLYAAVDDPRIPAPVQDTRSRTALRTAVTATRDRHAFTFNFTGLTLGEPYELRVSAPGSCGRVAWQGPARGLVFAGQPRVSISGYALRSELEVQAIQDSRRSRPQWVGADHLDLGDAAHLIRQFRWRTGISGVAAGILQVATAPFPLGTESACAAPPGLVYSSQFRAAAGQWNTVPAVNFRSVAAQINAGSRLGAAQLRLIGAGAPLYVRVVPVGALGPICDSLQNGPSPWVILARALSGSSAGSVPGILVPGQKSLVTATIATTYTRPWIGPEPQGNHTSYRVIKNHFINPLLMNPGYSSDAFWNSFLVNVLQPKLYNPGDTVVAGFRFYTWPPDSSGGLLGDIIDGFVSVVSGLIDAVGDIVDYLAKAYADIQKEVVKVVAAAVTATGLVDCSSSPTCQELIQVALQTGLQAMGLPPSLPSWDAVVDGGYDYMAAEIVSAAGVGGIPGAQELTEAAAKELVKKTMEAMDANRGAASGTGVDWMITDLGVEPAVVTLHLVTDTQGSQLPDVLELSGNAVFHGARVALPSQWPAPLFGLKLYNLSIPVVLQPNLSAIQSPVFATDYQKALYAKEYFGKLVAATPCVNFTASLFRTAGFSEFPMGSAGSFTAFPSATGPVVMPASAACTQ